MFAGEKMRRLIFCLVIHVSVFTNTALSAEARLVEIHSTASSLKYDRGLIVADPAKPAFKITPIDEPILCPTSTACNGKPKQSILDELDRPTPKYLKPPLPDTVKIPIPNSVEILNTPDCRSIFQTGIFVQSPFLDRICDRYQVVRDSDKYVHFVNRMSGIVSVDGINYLALDLSENASLSFAAWYGSALDIVVSEVKNIADKSPVDIGQPYLGPPMQDLQLKLFVDFQVMGETNDGLDPIVTDPGISIFSSTEVTKYPSLGIFWVKGKLTPYGRSIFQQAAKSGRNLFDVISWEVSHNFKSPSGDVVLSSVGTIPCFRVSPASNGGGLVMAESCGR